MGALLVSAAALFQHFHRHAHAQLAYATRQQVLAEVHLAIALAVTMAATASGIAWQLAEDGHELPQEPSDNRSSK